MVHEYPQIYEKFKCIGGKCSDSCCVGWEVDVDETMYYYYLTVKGKMGDRIRSCMVYRDGEATFPLNEEGRCPFLNSKNLCDIITELGEDSLCTVCTEYPRYYEVAGDYEQIDMSLSCPEVSRLFFMDEEKYEIILFDDGFDNEDLPKSKAALRDKLRDKRNAAMNNVDNIDIEALYKRLKDKVKKDVSPEDKSSEEMLLFFEKELDTVLKPVTKGRHKKDYDEFILKQDPVDLLSDLETLDNRWKEILSFIKKHDKKGDLTDIAFDFLTASGDEKASLKRLEWMLRTLKYLIFRYTIEAYFDEDVIYETVLIKRCMLILLYMCAMRHYVSKGHFEREDMEDIAHIFSRQIEHSEDNLEILKGRSIK